MPKSANVIGWHPLQNASQSANQSSLCAAGRPGVIGLPGGGSLPGETPEQTLVREVREELARGVRLVTQIGTARQFFYAAEDDCHYDILAVFFLAEFPDEPSGRGSTRCSGCPWRMRRVPFFTSAMPGQSSKG
jgi:8-oxo-dGTP pyrophosphatase MutT (NUDIX family)